MLRADVARKRLFASATERLPAATYSPEVTTEVSRSIGERAAHILAKGHSVIVDAV